MPSIKPFHPVLVCVKHNLRRLIATPRAWVALVLGALILENQFAPIRAMLVAENLGISWPGLLTYLFNDPVVTMLTALMLLMLLFDVPMVDETQRYIISRTGRGAWARGQVIYVLLATLIFIVCLMGIVLLLCLPWIEWGGWSSGLKGLVEDGLYETYDTMLNYDPWIMQSYTPLGGAVNTMLLHYMGYSLLALILTAANACFRTRLGFLVAAIPVMLDQVADEFFGPRLLYALPLTLTRLSSLDYGDEMGRPSLLYAYLLLELLLALGAILTIRLLKKREIQL